MTQTLTLIAAAALVWYLIRSLQDASRASLRRQALRRDYFAALTPDQTRTEPSGLPRVALTHDGHRFDLQAIPDALALRKLPCLWLMVTLTEPQALTAETRIMARPSGLEPFSTFASLPHQIPLPPDFPSDCALRSTEPQPVLPQGLADLFTDPKVKELTLSPKGLRFVVLIEQAPRNAYLIFREADLPQTPLNPATAQTLMTQLITLQKAQLCNPT